MRLLYRAADRARPWLAGSFFLVGLGMAIVTAAGVFEFDRLDARLGAVAAWLVLMVQGLDMGLSHVADRAEP